MDRVIWEARVASLLSPAWFMIEAEQREAGFPAKALGQADHDQCSPQ